MKVNERYNEGQIRGGKRGGYMSARELCHIAIFTSVIIVCSQIMVPMPVGVPMTLQTFAIPLAGMLLGKKNGTISAAAYILLGIIGVPVFAGFAGGLGVVFGSTGGFILSFPVLAYFAGVGSEKRWGSKTDNTIWLIAWLSLGAAINYLCGMLMFSFVASVSLGIAFAYVVVPFIPTAIIKIAMVAILGKSIERRRPAPN